MTGIDTASWISRILSASAMRACSAVVTSMITPPFSISASPLFTRIVPISAIGAILAFGPCLAETAADGVGLGRGGLRVPVDDRVPFEVEERAQAAALEVVRGRAPVARDEDVRVVLRVPDG